MNRFFGLLMMAFLLLPTFSATAANDPQYSGVASSLGLYYPNIPLKQIAATPVEGVYEVVTQKDEILYFAPQTGHIFAGELWSPTGHNLTRESYNTLMQAKADMFPLEKALKIGNGPNQVIEVSDPDCPFCREGSAFFSARSDVTRYIYLFPLSKIHPEAEAKARYILSAEDPIAAYEDVFSGMYDKEPLPPVKDNGLLEEQRKIVEKVGIRATPRYWINGHFVSGTNLKEFEALLDKK